MKITNKICIGLMSGTSLDGLDIVAVQFSEQFNTYKFNILHSHTIEYSTEILDQLESSSQLSGLDLTILDHELAKFFSEKVLEFIEKNNLNKNEISIIASHGHTVFHQPENGFTLQIGNGAKIAALTGIDTINNFRIEDVVRGGQGAPLVPIGDQFLFSEYDACINLGGFSNISFFKNKKRIAFDIAPCNLPLNLFASFWNMPFDKNGKIASKGKINDSLLKNLNELNFYFQNAPKSLGIEWLEHTFYPLIKKEKNGDTLATIVEHIAIQIANTLNENTLKNVLITGGGAFNSFLIERIQSHTSSTLNIPNDDIINYKEAVIFAFLGWLRIQNKINTLHSVTGSSKDRSNGIIYRA